MAITTTGQVSMGISVLGPMNKRYAQILTPASLSFLASLARKFEASRQQLLAARQTRQSALNQGERPDFLTETLSVRQDPHWQVAPVPAHLNKRWTEITGPTERKMVINALNSGADVFMADFEDSNTPSWENVIQGQINLRDAIDRKIDFTSVEGKDYRLNEQVATLMVRPRGWHLDEPHVQIDGQPISASLFDFGLFFFHNAHALLNKGQSPAFYLPKLESHREARLWNEVFLFSQETLGLPVGTIRATVLIETILAAFEMEEILYELRQHILGLNAGRWDYIFSIIKKFRSQPECLLPDRALITMTAPFMRAYTERLVQTCHRRGAHAIGGMSAYIPSRKDPQANEIALEAVRTDKRREAGDGFDGTWVAHPDLVPVARQIFSNTLGENDHQKHRLREEVNVQASDLLNFQIPQARITEKGLRQNISIGILYLESWLRGNGAAAIFNLMEDTATAEISRAQVWQWLHAPGARLDDGREISMALYEQLCEAEVAQIRALVGEAAFRQGKFAQAIEIFNSLATAPDFEEFLTIPAYRYLVD